MRPRVTGHVAVSLDGRVTGFEPDVGLYYELARSLGEDATLTSADTMLAAPLPETEAVAASPDAPLLVVTDSRGRVRVWERLLGLGYWRAGVSLCTTRTPQAHLHYLESCGVAGVVAGEEHVDLAAALQQLHARFGVERVRVDSGLTLLRALISDGVLDELSVVLEPVLAEPGARLDLVSAAEQRGGAVWLRYVSRE